MKGGCTAQYLLINVRSNSKDIISTFQHIGKPVGLFISNVPFSIEKRERKLVILYSFHIQLPVDLPLAT